MDDEVEGELESNPKVPVRQPQRSLPLVIESLCRWEYVEPFERGCVISRLVKVVPLLHLPKVLLLIQF